VEFTWFFGVNQTVESHHGSHLDVRTRRRHILAPDMPFFDSLATPPNIQPIVVQFLASCTHTSLVPSTPPSPSTVLAAWVAPKQKGLAHAHKILFRAIFHFTVFILLILLLVTMNFQKTILALVVASAAAFAPLPLGCQQRLASTSSLYGAVEDRVKEIISAQLSVDASRVVPAATFVDDLGADSLDTVELIMAIEEEFDCEIPEEEAANISTVQEVIDYVSKL
jgi:acyl carrier protein